MNGTKQVQLSVRCSKLDRVTARAMADLMDQSLDHMVMSALGLFYEANAGPYDEICEHLSRTRQVSRRSMRKSTLTSKAEQAELLESRG